MEDACTSTSHERLDELHGGATRRRLSLRRSPATTRESSPLLVVQPSLSEREGTDDQGRTVFPLSSSTTDLTTTSSSEAITVVVAIQVSQLLTVTTLGHH